MLIIDNIAQVTSGISPASTNAPSTSYDVNAEDINNPLMEGVAQLSITPSGQRRMYHAHTRNDGY
jgi:hypothetical protein